MPVKQASTGGLDPYRKQDAKTLIGLSWLVLGDRLVIIKQLDRSNGRTYVQTSKMPKFLSHFPASSPAGNLGQMTTVAPWALGVYFG